MFKPNYIMSNANVPQMQIPVMVKFTNGIRGESSLAIWTQESWDAGYGEYARLDRNYRVPKALYIRDSDPLANIPMVKQSKKALNAFVLTKF